MAPDPDDKSADGSAGKPIDEPGGANFVRRVPDGDNRARLVCEDCGFINYDNPKIVVLARLRILVRDRFVLGQ